MTRARSGGSHLFSLSQTDKVTEGERASGAHSSPLPTSLLFTGKCKSKYQMGLPQQLHEGTEGGSKPGREGGWDRRVSVNNTTKNLTREGKGKTGARETKTWHGGANWTV